jgi:hypothetical protein
MKMMKELSKKKEKNLFLKRKKKFNIPSLSILESLKNSKSSSFLVQ